MITIKLVARYGMELWELSYSTTEGRVVRTFWSEEQAQTEARKIRNDYTI